MIIATRAIAEEEGKDDDTKWGKPLPAPLCGCCRQPLTVVKIKGSAYRLKGEMHQPVVEKLIWRCKCRERRERVQCFFCTKCAECCKCLMPALEAQ